MSQQSTEKTMSEQSPKQKSEQADQTVRNKITELFPKDNASSPGTDPF